MGLVVTLLAVLARLVWVWLVPTRPVGDFAMYVESARYLVAHHAMDPEFIYMPGYVFLVAGVDALGGGLLAIKMIGVAAGGLTTAAAYGAARALFGRGPALAAGLLCALWPAGIAVSSVTGTDMPAAALLAVGVWLLARNAERHPVGAPVLFGLMLGLASTIRAVALPLVAFAALHFRARGAGWFHAATRTVLAGLVAVLVLLPWGLRNHHLYGELFLTDSHGGHTALVGANPNSEGTYSRSLNRLFAEGTGYRLFVPPVRESDRVAYAMAKRWTREEPAFAAGLLAAKADRLLTYERNLLYWPLYRQSVLPAGSPTLDWFSRHRTGVERLADGFWYGFVACVLIGVVAAAARRNWAALSLLPLPLALAGLYTLFFAEVRYHLAIAALLMPFAGAGLVWIGEAAYDLGRRTLDRQRRPRLPIEAAVAAAAIALVFVGWPRLVAAGARLRDRHRWAASVCQVAGEKRICDFLPTEIGADAPSPVRGVWDGFGLRLTAPEVAASATVEIPSGRYRVSALAEGQGTAPDGGTVALIAGGARLAQAAWPSEATPITLAGTVEHPGGELRVEMIASGNVSPATVGTPSVWFSSIQVELDAR